MTTSNIPIWRDWSLKQHHEKHCVNERDCFQDVLDSPVPVAKSEYEKTTERAFQKAFIQYDAKEANRQDGGFYPMRHYRLDGRSLKTIADPGTTTPRLFRSCFHVHYGKPHDPEELNKPELDQVFRYLEKLEDDRGQDMISNCKVQVADGTKSLGSRNLLQLASEINRLNDKM